MTRRGVLVLSATAVSVLTALSLSVVGHGQAPPVFMPRDLEQTPPPVFRSKVEAVAIDVFVTDAAGNPVGGLTVDDFELDEDGKRQDITTFEAVDLPIETRSGEASHAEPDVTSNDQPEGRVYVFAFAVSNGCDAVRGRQLLHAFISSRFGRHDVAAVVNLGRSLATDGQDFTSNRRLLLQAVDKLSGWEVCGDKSGNDHRRADRDPRVLTQSIRDVIAVLGRMPGRHKSLLYLADGPGYPWGDLIDYTGGVGSLTFASDPRRALTGMPTVGAGPSSLMFDDAHGAMAVATKNNITIYPIDPRGLTSSTGATEGSLSLEARMDFRALAEITGGFALVNSNEFDTALDRIVREASTYYMLGFNSGYTKNDGKFVRLAVRVKRPGLTVRTRTGYVNANRWEHEAETRARQPRTPVLEALASPLTSAGHPIRVAAAAYKGSKGNANVVLTLETALVPSAKQSRADLRSGSVEIRYITTDARKQIYPEIRHIGTLSIPVAAANASGDRVRLVSELELAPGRYQVRVASGAGSLAGSVVYDLEVPDFSGGPLMLSGLSLTTNGGVTLPTVGPVLDKKKMKTRKCHENQCVASEVREVPLVPWSSGSLAPAHPLHSALPAPPTTVRSFTRSETVTLFAEVYDNRPPRGLTVRAELRQPNGPAVINAAREIVATDSRRPNGSRGVTLPLALANVTPGRYVLRLEAAAPGTGHVAAREIPIEVLP